jgi:hypothetical protein
MAPQLDADPAWLASFRARPARGLLEVSFTCPRCSTPYQIQLQLQGWRERVPVPRVNSRRLARRQVDRGTEATTAPSTELYCSRCMIRTPASLTLDA